MKPRRIREILPATYRFAGERFYGEEVGVPSPDLSFASLLKPVVLYRLRYQVQGAL
jgi:hypothetical protein